MAEKKLLDQLRDTLRLKHYAYKTEKVYVDWCKRYIKYYHYKRHPATMGRDEVEQFLSYLATERNVSSSTQNQALSAILFLYEHVLRQPLEGVDAIRAKSSGRLPTVLSQNEVKQILALISNHTNLLIIKLLYGCGLRISEALRLRIKDLDFDRDRVSIIDSKHNKSRSVEMPISLKLQLQAHLVATKQKHGNDLENGYGAVYLPFALAKKYPNAAKDWQWQYVFPSVKLSEDPRNLGHLKRHHITENGVRFSLRQAVKAAGITKKVSLHTFRHSYATHQIERGVDITNLQQAMGHKDIKVTRAYIHLANTIKIGNPLDEL